MTAFALLAATPAHFARLLNGEPPEVGLELPASEIAPPEVLAMLASLAQGIEASFAPAAWLAPRLRLIPRCLSDSLCGLSSRRAPRLP